MAEGHIKNGFWDNYGNTAGLYEITCEGEGSLAAEVAEYFGLTVKTPGVGGALKDIDVKHQDALGLIKLSLLEASADGVESPYEVFVDFEDDAIEFRKVGDGNPGINHVYHTIQTYSYVEKCAGVMVTGRDPLPYMKETDWSPIWGNNPNHVHIYDTTDMISNCNRSRFIQEATIAFRDPHLNSEYNDGIDNLYEIRNPFEKIQGYVVQRVAESEYFDSDVTMVDSNKTRIPIRVGEGGQLLGNELYKLPTPPTDMLNIECWTEVSEAPGNFQSIGVPVEIPDTFRFSTLYGETVDNFVDVVGVYVLGKDLKSCQEVPKDNASGNQTSVNENTEIWVWMDSTETKIFRLEYGLHYVIGYDPGERFKTPYIVFGDCSADVYDAEFGSNAKYYIRPNCPVGAASSEESAQLTGAILPRGNETGILVEQVWAVVELDCPSVKITDPKGKAGDIALSFKYNLMPIVVVDEPPPVALNGVLIDQAVGRRDSDPTTVQDFEDTPYEIAMDEMDKGGGLNLHLSFLDEEQCVNLSRTLYNYMGENNGIQTTSVCGPECTPLIGAEGPNGIINEIQYQYSDKGSYTISVTEGPRIIGGFASISNSASIKETETRSSTGTVVDNLGNGIYFKVRIDGMGVYLAFNMSHDVIRIGDQVQCSIHNLPVED